VLLYRYALLIVVSFLAAGLASAVLPEQWMARNLGDDSGLRGILLAAAAGVVTPAGPFVSIPIAAVMLKAGAVSGPVVAFLAGDECNYLTGASLTVDGGLTLGCCASRRDL
jgi:uncharacterized membrane protein YraQ (UPF0718 family)